MFSAYVDITDVDKKCTYMSPINGQVHAIHKFKKKCTLYYIDALEYAPKHCSSLCRKGPHKDIKGIFFKNINTDKFLKTISMLFMGTMNSISSSYDCKICSSESSTIFFCPL